MINLLSSVVLLAWSVAGGDAPVPLAGTWAFRLDPTCAGEEGSWYNDLLPDRIELPGTTDRAGYGEKTKGAEVGHLSRVHKYVGPAWYQRDIEIPPSWEGRTVELFLERVLWESKVWIDDRFCDSQESLHSPHLHRLGKLTPGKHRLTIRVNNAEIHPIGTIGSCYTEDTQTIWNGIVGRIELRAHGDLWLERQRVFPQNDGTVRIELTIHSELPDQATGIVRATVLDKTDGKVAGTGEAALEIPQRSQSDPLPATVPLEITVTLAHSPRLWSEFTPQLYSLHLELRATSAKRQLTDSAEATFGFRTVAHAGRRLLVNDRPTFVRGNVDCVHFPLTGYPPCDVESWRRLFRIYHEYGLNQVRFHSWCPPEAAFQAADEMGIHIQAEAIWIDHATPERPKGVGRADRTVDTYVRAEMRRILDTYGNHPSFVFFAIGNELGGSDFDVLGQWIEEEKRRDPRRLYAASTARAITAADDFSDTHLVPKAGSTVNRLDVPHTDWDYEQSDGAAPVPIIAHEAGQMPVYPCWDEIGKYTGVLRARNLEGFREKARKNGIEAQNKELQQASGASNRIIYKNEMEAQLRTPSSSGISWLSMQDYSGQDEALVGWLDSFYDSKGFLAPARFRRYCSSTVPLARFKKYVWTNREKFHAVAQLAHWGPEPLVQAVAAWRLRDAQNKDIASGQFPAGDLPVGAVTALGSIEVDLSWIESPSRLNLEITLQGTEFANDWDLWVFPQPTTADAPASVVLCDQTDTAINALAEGKRVMLLGHRLGPEDSTRYAAWRPLFWSAIYMGAKRERETLGALIRHTHPALAEFPTDAHLDWQWHDICQGAHGFVLDELPADYCPIVQPVSDFHFSHKLGTIFEFCTKDGGRLLVCGYNLVDNLADRPAASQLRKSLLDYVASPAFAPSQEITAEQLAKLFSGPPPVKEAGQ